MFKKIISFIRKLLGLKPSEGSINYISGNESLPKPLELEAEIELVERLMNKDLDARSKLIEHNLRLVVYIAKKYESSGVDIEDLISVGTIGLIKAVNTYDNTKNIKLATYSARCIENEILMHLRKTVKTRGDISLDEPLNVDWEGNVLLLSDVLGVDAEVVYKEVESNADRDILEKCTSKLSDREALIIKMRFGILGVEKKTQREIADIMGISQSYISRLEKKVLSKLKKEIIKLQ